jgi:hypothetical protein
MADARTAKTKDDWTKWRDRPRDSSRTDEARKRAALWDSFNAYCTENRGWIISPPGSRVAILETEKGSTLPEKLVRLGYSVTELPGDYSRLIGAAPSPEAQRLARRGHAVTEPCAGLILEVSRYSVALPWGAPPARR